MIESAVQSLLAGQVDTDNPAISFARQVELAYRPTEESGNKSWHIADVFIRQREDTLYLLELGPQQDGAPKY